MSGKSTIEDQVDAVANAHFDSWVEFVRAVYPAMLVGAAVFAFLTQPLVRYIDFYSIYAGAALFAASLITLAAVATFRRDTLGIVIGLVSMFGGWYFIGGGLDDAATKAAINDKRCLVIEREMLAPQPRRGDLPDIFNALGCHAQSNLNIQMPNAAKTPRSRD